MFSKVNLLAPEGLADSTTNNQPQPPTSQALARNHHQPPKLALLFPAYLDLHPKSNVLHHLTATVADVQIARKLLTHQRLLKRLGIEVSVDLGVLPTLSELPKARKDRNHLYTYSYYKMTMHIESYSPKAFFFPFFHQKRCFLQQATIGTKALGTSKPCQPQPLAAPAMLGRLKRITFSTTGSGCMASASLRVVAKRKGRRPEVPGGSRWVVGV